LRRLGARLSKCNVARVSKSTKSELAFAMGVRPWSSESCRGVIKASEIASIFEYSRQQKVLHTCLKGVITLIV
jgi:hypothetical protein